MLLHMVCVSGELHPADDPWPVTLEGNDRALEQYVDVQASQAHRRAACEPWNDARRLHDMALDTASWRRVLNSNRRGSVPIGEGTSDNGCMCTEKPLALRLHIPSYVVG